nr:unnamed protein product [Digitaria exilis]
MSSGLRTTYLPETHLSCPSTGLAGARPSADLMVTEKLRTSSSALNVSLGGFTSTFTDAGTSTSTAYVEVAAPTLVTERLAVAVKGGWSRMALSPHRYGTYPAAVMLYTSPGSTALCGFTCPAPRARNVAGLPSTSAIGFRRLSVGTAVVISADLIAAGDHVGCACLISAAIPLRCGAAMDVPDLMSNLGTSALGANSTSSIDGTPARTFTPGPMMSGFKIPRLRLLGPREEKGATIGDCGVRNVDPLKTNVAVPSCEVWTYSFIFCPVA